MADGLPIVVVGLGVFALPEIVDLLRQNKAIAAAMSLGSGWRQGIRDTMQNMGLVLRCSGIGCLIGALPGLGGSVVDWVAYGHVVQTSRDRSQFGRATCAG